MAHPAAPAPNPDAEPWRALRHIEEALRGLRFGQVTVIIQDGVVVQIERTERQRFSRSGKLK
jgi:hypothetical protein